MNNNVFENNIKVSVVLPVYNVELYIRQCLDTVVGQTLKEIEIILVNDSSTDGTLDIMEEYAKRDSRITILHQENKGAGVARNTGLKVAKGEYISFLDPDDFFELTMLEELYNKGINTGAEVIVCDAVYYDDSTQKIIENKKIPNLNKAPNKDLFSCLEYDISIFFDLASQAWNKLFKLDFVRKNQIQFSEIFRVNDVVFNVASFLYSNKVTILDKVFIYYRINMNTSSKKNIEKYPLSYYQTYNEIEDLFKKITPSEKVLKDFATYILNTSLNNFDLMKTFENKKIVCEQIHYNTENRFHLLEKYSDTLNSYNINRYKEILSNPVDEFTLKSITISKKFEILLEERNNFNELCFYGSGKNCNSVLELFKKRNLEPPIAICDSNPNKQGEKIDGIPIISIDEAVSKYKNLTLLITSKAYINEIYLNVKEYISDENIYLIPKEL